MRYRVSYSAQLHHPWRNSDAVFRTASSADGIVGYNLIGLVHLPDSSVLTTAFCQLSTGECLTATRIEDTKAHVRVGPFAIDQSYWQLYVAFRGLNTSISVVGGMRQLQLLVEPLNCAAGPPAMGTVNCSDYELVLLARYQWLRPGAVSVGADGSMTFSPMGHERMILQPTMDPSSIGRAQEREGLGIEDELARSVATLRFSMGKGAVGMREGRGKARPRLAEIRREVVARCADEKHRYAAFGKLGEVKEALQAATMWNYVVSPARSVSASESLVDFVKNASSLDWNYVIFDWDNIFATRHRPSRPRRIWPTQTSFRSFAHGRRADLCPTFLQGAPSQSTERNLRSERRCSLSSIASTRTCGLCSSCSTICSGGMTSWRRAAPWALLASSPSDQIESTASPTSPRA